ncbi:MAG TPA: beta-propeller fold lactonase family protein [Luteolibacter sp.]|nr:beta-propeller fold lactonase family protein [Luteolibacter sp.]
MYDPKPAACIQDLDKAYSLINSVAFHPTKRLFCATYTNSNALRLFRLSESGKASLVQQLSNPRAKLASPQHAVFSPDGRRLIVANWSSENFTVHARGFTGRYSRKPIAVSSFPERLASYKPHGIEISPSGKSIAVAFGAALFNPMAIGLFAFDADSGEVRLLSLVEGSDLAGIPKGICFTPDETAILVTFSNTHGVAIYGISADSGVIDPKPRQIVTGPATGFARPEDIKLTRDGNFVIVTNSGANTLTFHAFDPATNRITQDAPARIMEDPESGLNFPHGVALSLDGDFMVVSHFGPIETTADENIRFSHETPSNYARITIYRREKAETLKS